MMFDFGKEEKWQARVWFLYASRYLHDQSDDWFIEELMKLWDALLSSDEIFVSDGNTAANLIISTIKDLARKHQHATAIQGEPTATPATPELPGPGKWCDRVTSLVHIRYSHLDLGYSDLWFLIELLKLLHELETTPFIAPVSWDPTFVSDRSIAWSVIRSTIADLARKQQNATAIQGEPTTTPTPPALSGTSLEQIPAPEPDGSTDPWAFLPKNEPYRACVIDICRGAVWVIANKTERIKHGKKLSANKIAKEALDFPHKWWRQANQEREPYSHEKIAEWVAKWLAAGRPNPDQNPPDAPLPTK
ncbi:MAG: hypothetical protein H7836_12290 [Magnetococcus sp. YQC-3]